MMARIGYLMIVIGCMLIGISLGLMLLVLLGGCDSLADPESAHYGQQVIQQEVEVQVR
jgi:hypothetical protein